MGCGTSNKSWWKALTQPLAAVAAVVLIIGGIFIFSDWQEWGAGLQPSPMETDWGFPPGNELAATGETGPFFTVIGSDGIVIHPEMEVVTPCAGPSVRYGPYTDFLVAVDPGGGEELIVVVDTSGKQLVERTEFGTVLIASPLSVFNSRLGPTTAWQATLTTEQLTISVHSAEDGMEFMDFELLVPGPEPSTQEGGD